MNRRCSLALLALALSLAAPALAQQFGPSMRLPNATIADGRPRVAPGATGTWVAVVSSHGFGDTDILAARSSDGGLTWSAGTLIEAPGDTGADVEPRVATDEAGTWVTVWTTVDSFGGTIGTDGDIAVARSTDDGVTWSVPAPLDPGAASDSDYDLSPDLDTDGTGTWIAVWRSDALSSFTRPIVASRSTDAGATWSAPVTLSGNSFSAPRIASDRAGAWVVVTSYAGDVLVIRSTDGGLTWTAPAPIDPAQPPGHTDDGPTVTTDRAGTWVAAWTRDLYGVLSARSTDGGVTWSVPQSLVNEGPYSIDVQITADGAGGYLATWRNYPVGRLARSTDGGVTWTAPVPFGDIPDIVSDRAGSLIASEYGATVIPGAFCGDGRLGAIEGCDDGNLQGGDGCEATCAPTGCGDGVTGPGEQCDDGNIGYGDCCSPGCRFEPLGNPCPDDGNPCTDERCDGAAVCQHPSNTDPCDDHNLCTVSDVCAGGICAGEAVPRNGCFRPAQPGKGLLRIQASRRLTWRWIKGEAFSLPGFFEFPHAVCVYDASMALQPRLSAQTRTGTCGHQPCWRAAASGPPEERRVDYIDPERTPDGIGRLSLDPGVAGATRALVQGRGANLDVPPLPLVPPVRAQILSAGGQCWEAFFSSPRVNDAGGFTSAPD